HRVERGLIRIVATVALILAAASSVEASCSWVLWIESKRVGKGAPPGGDVTWRVRQTFEQRAECVNGLKDVRNEREAIIKRPLVQIIEFFLSNGYGPTATATQTRRDTTATTIAIGRCVAGCARHAV